MNEIYKVREKCGICGNKKLDTIIEYNEIPLAGDFPSKDELSIERKYDMNLQFCDECTLLQTNSVIDAKTLFLDYRYMSSIGLTKHFTGVANFLKERFNLSESSKIVEIGSNDGVLLKPLQDLGLKPIGFEPAINISQIAKDKGCEVINDFFNEENGVKYIGENCVDLMVSNNCFAHIDDIHSIVKGVNRLLKKDGHFVIEVHYVKNLIEQLQYDNSYHEHIYYYSLTALNILFSKFGMTIVDFEEIPIHAGSIRVMVKNSFEAKTDKVMNKLNEEHTLGLTELPYFQQFATNVKNHIKMINDEIVNLKKEGYKIVGYGASGRANMLCNLCNLTPDLIDYIVDESPERCGRYIAGKHIPIVSKEHLLNDTIKPDYVFIFAWNFSKMIIEKLEGNNFKYIIGFPHLQIVSNYDELKDFVSI